MNVQPVGENGVAAISNGQLSGNGGSGMISTPPERNISQQTNVTMVTVGSGDSGTSSPHTLIPDTAASSANEAQVSGGGGGLWG